MEKLNTLAYLPEFLNRYRPAEGLSVHTEIRDALSLKPGLMKLYEIALHGGHPPESMGLPALRDPEFFLVGHATLRDPQGRILATATAVAPAGQTLEDLETAARQRLLAALGFGGEIVDADEVFDPSHSGIATPEVQAPVPVTETPVGEGVAMATAALLPGEDPAAILSASVNAAPVVPVATPADTLSRVALGVATSAASDDRALALLQRQIAHWAHLQGIAVPEVHTRAEGQAALKALMQQPTATL
ncbi:MAG: hypothetical protein IPL99_04810 [Candidatus Competibacteraceae bacterium]|nr:hypothetical protein [Candidatus Competibacteraceae bacterium]